MSDLSWFRNRFPYTKLNDINLDWLLKRMKELSALVVSYADDIQRALSQSSTAITQSETAVNSANNAVSIANGAAATADAVSGIAEDARTIASAANNTAIHAENVATGIAETAQSALDTAQNAETIANDAVQTAGNAQITAQNAETIANGANSRAGNAEQSALTAISTATAAQQTATAAQQAATAAAGDAQTAQQAATVAASDAQTAQQAATAASQEATNIAINKADIIIESAQGAIAAFTDGANNLPIVSLVVDREPVQSGSGIPSRDNLRPFVGITGLKIYKSGENMSDPETISVIWQSVAGTVYGAELTIENGAVILTVKWAMETHNGGFIKYPATTPIKGYFYKTIGEFGLVENHQCLANQFLPAVISTSNENLGIDVANSSAFNDTRILARPNGYTAMTENEFNAMLAETPLEVAYKLTNPVVYHLDEQEVISTLYGLNNFWSNAGDITLTYRADTRLYIQKINAPSSSDMVASSQIENNTYFIVGGDLYKSTAVILANDNIIPGSNCVHTNLSEALNALYALLT